MVRSSTREGGEEKQEDSGDVPEQQGMSSPQSNVTVEHKVASTSRAAPSFLAALTTPTGMMAAVFALGMTGGFGYFFNEWFKLPGLEDQVQELEQEVDRLESEVTRLEGANDEFEDLNDRLNSSVLELKRQTSFLNESLEDFEDLNLLLNMSNQELARLNGELRFENGKFAESNINLNVSIAALEGQVGNLTGQIDELENQTEVLSGEIDRLSLVTVDLESTNEGLNATVLTLQTELLDLANEMNLLRNFNNDLLKIITFVNETNEDVESLRGLAANVSQSISLNREALIQTMLSTYIDAIQGWDCAIRDTFRNRPYVIDLDASIGAIDYPFVMDYVDFRVGSRLCFDMADLELFLDNEYVQLGVLPPISISMSLLTTGVTNYALAALDYYFPDGNEVGLTEEDWAMAGFECEGLTEEKKFIYVPPLV